MERMKKIAGTIVFFIIGILLFQVISYMLRPTDKNFYRHDVAGFYGEEKNSIDIIGIGGSAMDRYFNNPLLWEEYQVSSYNMTTASQSCFLIEDLIDEIEKTQSPKLYVIETRKFVQAESKDLNSDKFCMMIDNMKYSWNRIEMINHMTDDWEERINYYFDIISYHESWTDFTYENLDYMDNEIALETKGWGSIRKVRKIREPKILSLSEDDALPISKVSEGALISLMNKCKEENIPVLFVTTPWKIDEESQRKNLYISQLIEDYGFDFLDCNLYMEEMGLDFSTDFYNAKHVNVFGSEKVTRLIGDYIQENYPISEEHSQQVIDEWDQAVAIYHKKVEGARKKIFGNN